MGRKDCFYPCTAESVVRFIEHENIDLAFKNVVVIGRSNVVGRPLVSIPAERRSMLEDGDAFCMECGSARTEYRPV